MATSMDTVRKGLNLAVDPHRRFNSLTGDWVFVSPGRTKRPWQGKVETPARDERPRYDPGCYLCPGNERAGGMRNPAYSTTFVFDNDFGSLNPGTTHAKFREGKLLLAQGEAGICRVVCFSPRHDRTLAELETGEIRGVVDILTDEFASLGSRAYVNYVQIFENKGEIMGCSNPHPHCQIWAGRTIPVEPAKEMRRMLAYRREHRRCLLCDYAKLELRTGERLVFANDAFAVIVPFWAVWPFETLVVSRRHAGTLTQLSREERDALADILKRLAVRYDNLFGVSFPYSSGFHQSPTDGGKHPEAHLHMHFYPPLLRSATVRKFMVGYEMLANPQRDITPEDAAARLRDQSEVHYTQNPDR
ncbi:MAG TPA: UDP-glucose--hexose-1-phosphate uridylyltransferase [Bacteroidota bacterium]|nr:UDP-glucose--hexose-1-phosphate uridylyltransferase [Bacteroidota bacterium]